MKSSDEIRPPVLAVCGNHSISSILAMSKALASIVQNNSSVQIDFGVAEHVDISTLQLITAVRRQGEVSDCVVSLSAPAPARLVDLLDRAGFLTAATPSDLEFWFQGARPL